MTVTSEYQCRERTLSWGLTGRRFALRADFAAEDFEQFQEHYTALIGALGEWHRRRGRRARRLELDGVIHPWIAGRIKDYLTQLRHHQALSFLQRLPMQALLRDEHGQPVAEWHWAAGEVKANTEAARG